jgi:hypothetical protein
MGVRLIGVHLTGVHLIGVCLEAFQIFEFQAAKVARFGAHFTQIITFPA